MFNREDKVPEFRLTAVQYVILGVFLLLGFGLWRLQIMHGKDYDSLAQQNRIKEVPILAPRGKLLDREGRIIVDNYPSFSAMLLRTPDSKITPEYLQAIAAGLHLDPSDLMQRYQRQAAMPGYQPIFVKYDITPDEVAFIEAHRNEFPELDTIKVDRRLYPKNGFMAHLIGYVGEVNAEMLNQPRFELYNSGDIVGQSGIEAEYNDLLMGKNGSRRVLVNSKGKEVGELSDQPATPGTALKLTIDLDLQIAAEEALAGQNGAIVAIDPHTGEVLAMVSRPVFDPNAFAVHIGRDEWNSLINNPDKPLMNKAIQAQLAPGSVFKLIMSVAGLQEGAISPDDKIVCNGGFNFGGHLFKCDQHHGPVNMSQAISVSCDTYFYTLGNKLGIGKISQYASAFGLGQKTGIDLPQEVSGVMPSEEWKVRNFKQKWYAGETISVSIGQGAVATTPIQLARAVGGITMGGRLRHPHVVAPENLPAGFPGADKYNEEKQIAINPENWALITDAMAAVTTTGTAAAAKMPGIDFAGKTGTAQTVSAEARKRMGTGGSRFNDNSWFVGVTPRREPGIVVAVLSQGAGWGWRSALLAAKVIKVYADKQKARQEGRPYKPEPVTPVKPDSGGADDGGDTPQTTARGNQIEIGGMWSEGDGSLHAGRIAVANDGVFHRALAAPGLEEMALREEQERQKNKNKRFPFNELAFAMPAAGARLPRRRG
jgi:penicillin-binding protein 2